MNTRNQKLSVNATLKNGASALALGVFAIGVQAGPLGAVWAQGAVSEDEDERDTIVVTGIRRSIEDATERKRMAEEVLDSITAVDIGALPDRSVAEALQRIPGIQLQRTNENRDPARLAAEGGGVFVRGLRWVRTETNGRDIFSASNGRELSFEDVSADLLAGVDVYKNPSAEQIEGGIGGIVNLRTRKPFDQDRLVAGSIDYNYADLLDKGFVSGSVLVSDRWDTGIGEIGLLFSASIAEIGNRTDSIQAGRYEMREDNNLYPTNLGYRRIDWNQNRNAYSGVVQWAPTDALTLTGEVLYAKATPFDVEHAVLINGASTGDLQTFDVVNGQFDSDNVLFAGEIPGSSLTYNTRIGDRKSTTADYSFNFVYAPEESPWTVSGDFQYVESSADVLSMTAFTQLGVAPFATGARPTVNFDIGGDDPSISISDPALQADKSAYWWAAAMDHIEDNDAQSYAGRLDLEYEFGDDKFLRALRFGGRATHKDAITRQSGYNWQLLSQQFWGSGGGGPVFLDETGGGDFAPAGPNAGLPNQSELITYDDFFRGQVSVPGVGWFPTVDLLRDTGNAFSYLESTLTSGWGWVPLTEDAYDTLNPQGDNVSAGINEQEENTYAGYVVARFGDEGDIMGVPFDGGLGVRVVHTETTGIGRGSAGGIAVACDTMPSTDCMRATAFVTAYNAEFGEYQPFTNSYTKVLPSFNIRFNLTEELQLRLAASRGMVRPDFSQIRPYENLTFAFQGNMFDPTTATPFTGQAGAPNLKPTMSTNVDASLEWYFGNGSLTFATFYKDISDYIFLQRSLETFTHGGETFDFEVLRQTNGSNGTLKGFEIAYQHFYDFLPGPLSGLGLQANFTFIDNNGGVNEALNPFEPAQEAGATNTSLPIEGISRTSYNVAGIYEKYGISARLAYNWRERYLLTTSAANINRPVYWEDYGQLDGSIFYTINEHAKIGVQATNILNTRGFLDVGDETLAPRYSWTDTDRRIAVIGRFKL